MDCYAAVPDDNMRRLRAGLEEEEDQPAHHSKGHHREGGVTGREIDASSMRAGGRDVAERAGDGVGSDERDDIELQWCKELCGDMKPRKYQLDAFLLARSKNVVIVGDTGVGKVR